VLAAIEPLVVGRGEDGEPNGGDDGAERTGGSGLIGSFGAAVDMSEAMDAGIAVRPTPHTAHRTRGVRWVRGGCSLRSFQRCRCEGQHFSPG